MSEHSPWWYNPPEKTRRQRIRERLTAKVSAIILICTLAGALTTIAVNEYIHYVTHKGEIKTEGLGLYWENGTLCDEINWGVLSPNQTKTLATYIVNEGDFHITINHFHPIQSPPPPTINVTLDYNQTNILSPMEQMPVNWILTVSANATAQSFYWETKFNVTIIEM